MSAEQPVGMWLLCRCCLAPVRDLVKDVVVTPHLDDLPRVDRLRAIEQVADVIPDSPPRVGHTREVDARVGVLRRLGSGRDGRRLEPDHPGRRRVDRRFLRGREHPRNAGLQNGLNATQFDEPISTTVGGSRDHLLLQPCLEILGEGNDVLVVLDPVVRVLVEEAEHGFSLLFRRHQRRFRKFRLLVGEGHVVATKLVGVEDQSEDLTVLTVQSAAINLVILQLEPLHSQPFLQIHVSLVAHSCARGILLSNVNSVNGLCIKKTHTPSPHTNPVCGLALSATSCPDQVLHCLA